MKKILTIAFLVFSVFLLTCCNKTIAKENNQSTLVNKEVNWRTNNTAKETLKNDDNSAFITISNVDFLSSKIGYMSLSYSKNNNGSLNITYKLLKTQDGGYHWTSIGNNDLIESTIFIDDKLGFGKESIDKNNSENWKNILVKTVDGGLNWSPVNFIKDANPLQVEILDKNTMFICAISNKSKPEPFQSLQIYRTVNGGETWDSINLPSNIGFSELGGMSWLSMKEGYVLFVNTAGAGNQLKILYYTNDGGKTWSIKSKSEIPPPKVDNSIGCGGYSCGIKFFSNGTGYLGEARGFVRKSTDGGVTFKNITDYDEQHPVPDFINSEEGYGIFHRTDLYHTTDGGENWGKIITTNIDLWNK